MQSMSGFCLCSPEIESIEPSNKTFIEVLLKLSQSQGQIINTILNLLTIDDELESFRPTS